MGWFLWGIAFGWAICALFWFNLKENEKVMDGAIVIFLALATMTLIVSVNLGIASGAIPVEGVPAPTSVGR